MSNILYIFSNIIFPIFALVGIGMLLERIFKPDLLTLSKLNFYALAPALVFVHLLDSQLADNLVGLVVGFNLVHLLLLFGISWLVFRLSPWRKDWRLLTSSALFNNSGNYGIPFAQLAFGAFGVQVMALVLVFQNVVSFTLGLWLLGGHSSRDWKQSMSNVLKMPVLYAVGAALLLNALQVSLPRPVLFPLEQLANGLVPIALLTLGLQLARSGWAGQPGLLTAAVTMRLLVAPLLAFALALVWPLLFGTQDARVFPVLVCASALPVAVNVYILASEYNQKPELASRIIFWSTLASAVTLTTWLTIFN